MLFEDLQKRAIAGHMGPEAGCLFGNLGKGASRRGHLLVMMPVLGHRSGGSKPHAIQDILIAR